MTRRHQNDSHGQRLWKLAHGEQDIEMERHLANCEECQEELFTLRQLAHYQQTTGGSLIEPPEALHTTLTGLFGTLRPDLVGQQPSTLDHMLVALQRITAKLILDTGTTPQTAGLRSAGRRRIRQLAFVSDVADLDLEITSRNDEHIITGQLGMDDVPGRLVISFSQADKGLAPNTTRNVVETSISENGHFSLTLPSGEWAASVNINDAVLLFPGLHL